MRPEITMRPAPLTRWSLSVTRKMRSAGVVAAVRAQDVGGVAFKTDGVQTGLRVQTGRK